MIHWPKNYNEEEVKTANELLPKEVFKEFNDSKEDFYGYTYLEKAFVFKPITYTEWINLPNGIDLTNKTEDVAAQLINKKICEICLIYGKEFLEKLPGLVMGIANMVYKISGFDALGTTVTY